MSLLSKAYDDVKDVRDIRNEYHASVQLQTEQCSDFLTRLYLLLHEVNRKCEVDDFDGELLKQFIYGCNDDSLVLKLRLEEKDDMGDPPDYGSLLLSIRREEAKRTRKKPAPKARVQQLEVVDVQQEADTEAASLKKEVESLRKEVAHLKQQRSQQLTSQPTQPQQSAHANRPTAQQSEGSGKHASEKPRLNFCFQCGLEGHKAWTCKNEANPVLVTEKFQLVKKKRQENMQGSR